MSINERLNEYVVEKGIKQAFSMKMNACNADCRAFYPAHT